MPTFEEILQASKFIFKISKNARAMSESVFPYPFAAHHCPCVIKTTFPEKEGI
jgi:hypothetical protein